MFSCNKVDDPELQAQQLCDNYQRLRRETDVLYQALIEGTRNPVVDAESARLMEQLTLEVQYQYEQAHE